MSKRCDRPGCHRQSKGSVGSIRYCFHCVANILGWYPHDPRLRWAVPIQLMDGKREMNETRWMPDVAVTRARAARLPEGR